MGSVNEFMERNHRPIIFSLLFVIVFVTACTFHGVIPVCHYLFGCDHGMHAAAMH